MQTMKSGFTLVELLVCVAIIMVLASMLLVGIQVVQENLSRLECVDHLRQLGHALHNYHNAYGIFPNETMPRNRDTLLYVVLLPFVEEQMQDLDQPGYVAVYTCPSRNRAAVGAKDDFAIPRHTSSLPKSVLGGQNVSILNYPGTTLEQVQRADGASNTIMLSHKRLPIRNYELDMGAAGNGSDIGWANYIPIGIVGNPSQDQDHHRLLDPRPDVYATAGSNEFGSPHTTGNPTLWTDGRVTLYSYKIYGNGLWQACCFWNDNLVPDLNRLEP